MLYFMRVSRKGETPLFALGTTSESWDSFGMGLETQVAFEHTDPREGRAWPEYQRQNLGVCVEDSAEWPPGPRVCRKAERKSRRVGMHGRGLLSSSERHWEEE